MKEPKANPRCTPENPVQFNSLTTHIFDPDDPYFISDAEFGVKESLMAKFEPIEDSAKQAENGFDGLYYDVEHNFVLAPNDG